MRGQNRRTVSNAFADLGLSQILRIAQTRAAQINSRELGVGKIRMIKDGIA
jgi:hypothetical protein